MHHDCLWRDTKCQMKEEGQHWEVQGSMGLSLLGILKGIQGYVHEGSKQRLYPKCPRELHSSNSIKIYQENAKAIIFDLGRRWRRGPLLEVRKAHRGGQAEPFKGYDRKEEQKEAHQG